MNTSIENNIDYFKIFNHINDPIIISDKKGYIVRVNQAALELFGYQQNEMMGKSINILIPQHQHVQHDKFVDKYPENKDKTKPDLDTPRELTALHSDGSEILVDIKLQDFKGYGEPFFVAIIHDITQKKKEQLKTEQEQQNILNIISKSPIAVGIFTKEDEKLFCNSRMREIFGYTLEEANQVHPNTFYAEPEDRNIILSEMNDKGFVSNRKTLMKHKNGQHFTVLFSLFPTEFNKKPAFLVWLYDITELENVKESLHEAKLAAEKANLEKTKFISHINKSRTKNTSKCNSWLFTTSL